MPLLHDNAVLPHDRALPGLPTLLNPAAVAELFNRRRLVGQVQHVAISYIKYKPGTSCLVGYRLACNGTTLDAYARALRRADRLTTERGAMLICPERLLELRLFPNDRRIVGLRKINHEQQAALLQRLVPQQNASWWHSPLERLVYKPERRYVARLVVEGRPQATLKFYTPACYAAARRSHMVTNGQMLRVPRLLGKRDRHAVVAYEWLEGQLAHAALSDPATDVAAFAPVGAALAELHAQPPGGLTSRTTQHEARALHAAAGAVAAVCPALASQAQRLARQLARRLVGLPATPGLVHGDFYARQVLLQGGGTVGLIDFDEAAYGDCTSDLANFLAHLEYEVLRGTLGRARAEAVGAALLEGYSGAGGAVTVQSLSHHVAARLLLLAPQPFRTFTSGWPTHTAALLERVAELAV